MPSNVIGFKINNTIHKYDHDHLANIPTTDPTLTQPGEAADAKVVGDTIGDKSNLNTDDKTNLVSAINEINDRFVGSVEDVVNEWLDEHPEATTTVQDGAVTAAKLANNAVTEPKLASNSVSSAKIQDGAVSSAKIDASAVTSAKIANNAVSTIHIQDGAITTTKLNSEAVTTVKISDGAVTEAKLASNAVSTAKLQDGAVTEGKINELLMQRIENPHGESLVWCIQTKIDAVNSYRLAVSTDGKCFTPVDGYENFLQNAPANLGTDWNHYEEDGVHIFTITYYSNDMDFYVAMTKDFITWQHFACNFGIRTASSFEIPYSWTPQIFKYNNHYYIAATIQEGIPESRTNYYGEGLTRYSGIYCCEITIDFDALTIEKVGEVQRINYPAITDKLGTSIATNNYCMDAWFEPTPDGLYCIVNDRYTFTIHVYKLSSGDTPFGSYELVKSNLFGLRNIEAPTVFKVSENVWKICACLYSAVPFGTEKNIFCLTNDFNHFYRYDTFGATEPQLTASEGMPRRMRNPSLFYMTREQQSRISEQYELKCCDFIDRNDGATFPVYDGSVKFLNGFDVSVGQNTFFNLIQNNQTINKITFTEYFSKVFCIPVINQHTDDRPLNYDGANYKLSKNNGITYIDRLGNIQHTQDLSINLSNDELFSNSKSHGITGSVAHKVGKICTINLTIGQANMVTGLNNEVVILSDELKPAIDVICEGFLGSGSATGTVVRVIIYRSGNISVYAPSALNSTLRLSATYICSKI